MAMEVLFENKTQMDEAVINHLIEISFKRNRKVKQYHALSLFVAVLATAATLYFGRLGLLYRQNVTILSSIATAVIAAYSFFIFFKNTEKNQIKAYQQSYSKSLMVPRKIKVYKNVMFQSAGKSHGEYKLYQFTDIESWEHYFLLHYGKSYVVIDKNGFTTGTAEEFEKFMNTKIQKNY